MKISKSPTRSRGSDEVLLIQGTNVSDTYLIYVDEQEWLIVELGALDHYYQYQIYKFLDWRWFPAFKGWNSQ